EGRGGEGGRGGGGGAPRRWGEGRGAVCSSLSPWRWWSRGGSPPGPRAKPPPPPPRPAWRREPHRRPSPFLRRSRRPQPARANSGTDITTEIFHYTAPRLVRPGCSRSPFTAG